MKIKRFLKTLDGAERVLGKLEKIAIKAFLLAILIYELYKIVAHH
jgi:hypothetical protein